MNGRSSGDGDGGDNDDDDDDGVVLVIAGTVGQSARRPVGR